MTLQRQLVDIYVDVYSVPTENPHLAKGYLINDLGWFMNRYRNSHCDELHHEQASSCIFMNMLEK